MASTICLNDAISLPFEPLKGVLQAFEQICDSGYELQLATACRSLLAHAQHEVDKVLDAVAKRIGRIEVAHERSGDLVFPGKVIGVQLCTPGNAPLVENAPSAARDDDDYRFARLTQAESNELQKVFDILRNGTLEDVRGLMAVLAAIHRSIMERAAREIDRADAQQ